MYATDEGTYRDIPPWVQIRVREDDQYEGTLHGVTCSREIGHDFTDKSFFKFLGSGSRAYIIDIGLAR